MRVLPGCVLRCLLAVFVTACGQGRDSGADAGPEASDEPVPGVLRGDGPVSSVRPGDGPVPTYPLRLVNPRAYPVIVFTSAGAGEVLLDTVPPGDSVEVNVQVDAEVLKLRALDLDGNELGEDFVSLREGQPASERPDSVTSLRWELSPRL